MTALPLSPTEQVPPDDEEDEEEEDDEEEDEEDDEEVILTYFFATYPVFPLTLILYQLPDVDWMVTVVPFFRTFTTLLVVEALFLMFSELAVMVPVDAIA